MLKTLAVARSTRLIAAYRQDSQGNVTELEKVPSTQWRRAVRLETLAWCWLFD